MTTLDRMIILVDMDGPLADFDLAFFDRCGEHGWHMEIDGPHEQTARFATDHVIDKEHRKAARKMVDTPGWFWNLPVVDGAIDGINDLAKVAEVYICTKPLEANPTCRDEKAAWVEKYLGDAWLKRLIITPHKGMVRGDILLDDAPHPDWFDEAFWEPVIFTSPWNGEGSKWADLQHWTWGDDIEELL